MLVLAATIAAPALSAAQGEDDGGQGEPPATVPVPAPGEAPPADPAAPQDQEVTAEGSTEATAGEPVEQDAGKQPRAKPSATKTVSVGDNFYEPRTITISVGDTITWRNDGQADHTATAENGSFDTGTFGPGERRSETFDEARTFDYYCIIHGTSQSGTVRVRSASGGGDGGGGDGTGTSGSGSTGSTSTGSTGVSGTGSGLPATGLAVLGLGAIGLGLIASGSVLGRLEGRPRKRSRLFSL
jgi:plastocyanin